MSASEKAERLAIHFERRAHRASRCKHAPKWHWTAGQEANALHDVFWRADRLFGRLSGGLPSLHPRRLP